MKNKKVENWRKSHREEYNAYMREYRKTEKNKLYKKEWYKKNKEKQLEYNKKYLAKKKK